VTAKRRNDHSLDASPQPCNFFALRLLAKRSTGRREMVFLKTICSSGTCRQGQLCPQGKLQYFTKHSGQPLKKDPSHPLGYARRAASGRDGPACRIQGLEARRKHHLPRRPELFHFVACSAFASLECMCPASLSIFNQNFLKQPLQGPPLSYNYFSLGVFCRAEGNVHFLCMPGNVSGYIVHKVIHFRSLLPAHNNQASWKQFQFTGQQRSSTKTIFSTENPFGEFTKKQINQLCDGGWYLHAPVCSPRQEEPFQYASVMSQTRLHRRSGVRKVGGVRRKVLKQAAGTICSTNLNINTYQRRSWRHHSDVSRQCRSSECFRSRKQVTVLVVLCATNLDYFGEHWSI